MTVIFKRTELNSIEVDELNERDRMPLRSGGNGRFH